MGQMLAWAIAKNRIIHSAANATLHGDVHNDTQLSSGIYKCLIRIHN